MNYLFLRSRNTFKNCKRCFEKFQTLMAAFPVNKNARLHSKQTSTDVSELKKQHRKYMKRQICTVKNKENELPENGGQIVKEMLKNKNINLSRFSYNRSIDEVHCRRKKRKISICHVFHIIVVLMRYITEERK